MPVASAARAIGRRAAGAAGRHQGAGRRRLAGAAQSRTVGTGCWRCPLGTGPTSRGARCGAALLPTAPVAAHFPKSRHAIRLAPCDAPRRTAPRPVPPRPRSAGSAPVGGRCEPRWLARHGPHPPPCERWSIEVRADQGLRRAMRRPTAAHGGTRAGLAGGCGEGHPHRRVSRMCCVSGCEVQGGGNPLVRRRSTRACTAARARGLRAGCGTPTQTCSTGASSRARPPMQAHSGSAMPARGTRAFQRSEICRAGRCAAGQCEHEAAGRHGQRAVRFQERERRRCAHETSTRSSQQPPGSALCACAAVRISCNCADAAAESAVRRAAQKT